MVVADSDLPDEAPSKEEPRHHRGTGVFKRVRRDCSDGGPVPDGAGRAAAAAVEGVEPDFG
jgi:hypothetical protein